MAHGSGFENTYWEEDFFGLFVRANVDVSGSEGEETTDQEHDTKVDDLSDDEGERLVGVAAENRIVRAFELKSTKATHYVPNNKQDL